MKISNETLGRLFDFFDFPIRFMYSRFGFLSSFLNKLMFWRLYSSDFDVLDQKFEKMHDSLQRQGVSFEDKVVLELGPGNSYINAFNFLLNGAKKVILVDKYSRQVNGERQKEFIKNEIEYVVKKYNIEKPFFIDDEFTIKSDFIEYIEGDILNLDLEADFIVSISVMEHVQNPRAVVERLSQVLSIGGFMFHHIDMRDHYNFNSPFLFYKYGKFVWESILTKPGRSFTNRARYDEFTEWFLDFNLRVILEEKERIDIPDSLHINSIFSNFKHLDVGRYDVLLKKVK